MVSVGGPGGLLAFAALLVLRAAADDCPCETCVGKRTPTPSGVPLTDSAKLHYCESFGFDCSCVADVSKGDGGGSGATCAAAADLKARAAAMNAECCDEATEDCSSGRPATCNAGCAHVMLPFFDDCSGLLGAAGAAQFDGVVALCRIILKYPATPPGCGPLPAGFEESYTLTGCANIGHCGTFTRVAARCTSGDLCPGGRYQQTGSTDPSMCNGVPVYQLLGGGDGPVLYRYDYGDAVETTYWIVTDSSVLSTCAYGSRYLTSAFSFRIAGGPPTAPAYSSGDNVVGQVGWMDYGVPYPGCGSSSAGCDISVTAGGR